jgi:hypothetical protein
MTWPLSALLGTAQNLPGSPTDSIAAFPEVIRPNTNEVEIKAIDAIFFILTQNSLISRNGLSKLILDLDWSR